MNIRTSSLFETSRSLILVFCITGWTQLEVSRFYQVFNQFKVSQAVFRGSLIDVRNDTKYRVHRLYTRALYCIPFHLKHAVLVKRRAKYVEVKWQESHFCHYILMSKANQLIILSKSYLCLSVIAFSQ